MSLTDSPGFDNNWQEESPDEQPPSEKRRWTRLVIVILTVAVLGGGILLVMSRSSGSGTNRPGSAIVSGQVINPQGTPIPDAQVYIEGMGVSVTTNDEGMFSIAEAPEGGLILVVGVTPEPPHFVEFTVQNNDIADLGKIVFGTGSN